MSDQLQAYADKLEDALKRVKPEASFYWRKMFGGAGYYADDVIFAAYMGDDSIVLKLPENDRTVILAIEGSGEGLSKEYVKIPPQYLEDETTFDSWVIKSIDYVATLPKKKKKSKK